MLAHSQWENLWMLLVCIYSRRTTTVGQADDPEAKRSRYLKASCDNDNSVEKKEKIKRYREKLIFQTIKRELIKFIETCDSIK